MLKAIKPYMLSIFCSCCYAGYNIVSKVSLDKGPSRHVLVVYAQAFGTLATAVLAIFFERKNKSKITKSILRDIFFLGLLGAVLGTTIFFAGLEHTSLNFCISHGQYCSIHSSTWKSDCRYFKSVLRWELDRRLSRTLHIMPLMISVLAWTVMKHPAPITLTSLTCLAGTLLTAILDHKPSSWRLSWNITLLAPNYSGIVVFGIAVYAQTLVIREKGPVFVTAFRPSSKVIVAIMGAAYFGRRTALGREYENRRKNLEIMESDNEIATEK